MTGETTTVRRESCRKNRKLELKEKEKPGRNLNYHKIMVAIQGGDR